MSPPEVDNSSMSGSTSTTMSSKNTPSQSVTSFYAHKSIFITGATGFIGKVLVEKLLTHCPDISKIYILLRPKNGQNTRQRLEDFVQCNFFTSCGGRLDVSTLRSKISAVVGDITVPQLGLSEEHRQTLIDNVSIVFHSAASVKFDDPLKECLDFNVLGTMSVMDLCKQLKKLDSFVHVSTAYAYCQLDETEEKVYPMTVTPEQMLDVAKWLDRDSLASLKDAVFEERPNTYTFTKALAEQYIKENRRREGGQDLPVAIARPSIVTATWKEPCTGWVDSYNGPGGASLLGSLGIARTMCFNPNNTADLIPVDIVSNALINIAWYTAFHNSNELKVYNITSGSVNPISWYQYLEYGRDMAVEYPSTRVVRPPAKVMTGKGHSPLSNFFTKWISEVLFAYLIDIILFICGQKPMMVRVVKKMHHAFDLLSYFVRKEWKFPCNNILALVEYMEKTCPSDKAIFYMDARDINWKNYISDCYMGFRRYLMKEPDSNIPSAKRRMKWVSLAYYTLLIIFFLSVGMLVYGGVSLTRGLVLKMIY